MGLTGCCKFFMVVINLLFWLIGLAIVICAVWMLTDPTFLFSMSQKSNDYNIALYVFLIVGVLMLIVAFFGCCGAFKESQCLLISFFCCLLVIMVAEIAAGAWAFQNRDKLDDQVRESVRYTVKEEYGVMKSRRQAFDVFQQQLKCCGADGPSDWKTSSYNIDRSNNLDIAISNVNIFYKIPESCCNEGFSREECEISRKVGITAKINPAINSQGCMDKLVETIHSNWTIILGLVIAIVVLESLGLIISLILCCTIKNDDNYKA